jgi:predicted metal-dependent HD superfamily phosphohydrolase
MSTPEAITVKAADFIFKHFKENLPDGFVYHNYGHTVEVVEAARKVGTGSKLSAEEMEIVELGCWFHDAGYTAYRQGHEELSTDIAAQFLREQEYPQEKIVAVQHCVLATKMPHNPSNILEEVICDADLLHTGKKIFFEKSALLRVEMEQTSNKQFSDFDWMKWTLDFLTTHSFHTKYAQKKYGERKAANLLKMQAQFRDLVDDQQKKEDKLAKEEALSAKKAAKDKRPERGIETMFRVTLRNHISLSAIADSKANTMLSINALIISIVVSVLMRQLDQHPALVIPTAVMLLVCILTITFATIATRPQVTSGSVTKEMVKNRTANLLFFGNFYKMELEDFQWGMQELLQDREYLYGSMIKDFYYLGLVLGKKYKYLRMCYNVFMYGMILSVLLFLIFGAGIHF